MPSPTKHRAHIDQMPGRMSIDKTAHGNPPIIANDRMRPTCILCKLMEKIIRRKVVEHLELNDLISKKQHGFVTGRSCVTQLLDVLDSWTKTLDDGGSVDAIYRPVLCYAFA